MHKTLRQKGCDARKLDCNPTSLFWLIWDVTVLYCICCDVPALFGISTTITMYNQAVWHQSIVLCLFGDWLSTPGSCWIFWREFVTSQLGLQCKQTGSDFNMFKVLYIYLSTNDFRGKMTTRLLKVIQFLILETWDDKTLQKCTKTDSEIYRS